jgi:hypothetical protein
VSWYRKQSPSNSLLSALESNVWNESRTNAPLRICNVQVFKDLMNEDYESIAVVFPAEGRFIEESGKPEFEFAFQYSNLFPVYISKEIAAKTNRILFGVDKIQQNLFNETFASEQGRAFLYALVAKAMGEGEGGTKTANVPVPPNDPSGIRMELSPEEQIEAEQI